MTEKIDLKNLDKSTWQKVKFTDIAINVRKTSKNPLKDGLTKAIGLGHIEPDNLNLLGYTDIAKEGTKFNKIFRKGQFLFGSRRAYLRQMARATFDGVCTANIMVFDVKDENLINRDLFEFIIRSDSFINCAINTSEGSLFPNAKWKYIAEYEFLLPPKDQQAQLAKLLWALDEVIEKEKEVLEKLTINQRVKNKILFNGLRAKFEYKKFGALCDIERGGSPRPIDDYITDDEDGLNWIKIGDVDIESKYITRTKQKIKSSGLNKTRSVHVGDLILSNSMSFGRPYILKIDGCIHDGWLVIRDKQNVFDKEFLYYYLSSDEVYSQFEKFAAGGVVSNLNKEIVKTLKIYLPTMDIQIQIKDELSFLDKNIKHLKSKILSSQSLQKSIINQIF